MLTTSINLADKEWTPIGQGVRSSNDFTGTPFSGTFDGGNNEIKGLKITSVSQPDQAVGLFGVVAGGTVKDVILTSVEINVSAAPGGTSTVSSELAGAVVGMLCEGGTVSGCTVGSEDDNSNVIAGRGNGGIVGRLVKDGTIENCTNYADITGTATGGNTGGIVGAAYYTNATM